MTKRVVAVLGGLAVVAVLAGAGSQSHVACPVTLPTSMSNGTFGPRGFNYGTAKVRVQLWKGGKLRAGILPDGGAFASVNEDGSIDAKQGWWRGVPGKLRISGKRIHATAPPLRAHVPAGYGSTGFNPAGLTFPTAGCWRVVGQVGRARLAYVVEVTKLERRTG